MHDTVMHNNEPGCRIARPAGGSRRLRSAVVKSAVAAVPAVALALSAGVASAATAQHGARAAAQGVARASQFPSATVTWHRLTLRNGWQAATGRRAPSYAVSNGVVYLTGGLTLPGAGGGIFAVLPKAARPSHPMSHFVTDFGGGEADLGIFTNGGLEVSSSPASNAQSFSSLAGISYPVAGTTWHKLNLINGWKSGQGKFGTGDPAYAVKNGIVYLSGSVFQPSGSDPTFAVLPRAARSGRKMYVTDFTWAGATGTLIEGGTGGLAISSGPQSSAQAYTSLAGISYPAAGTSWHSLSLINGWRSEAGPTGAPAYVIKNGVVYLSGAMHQPSGTNLVFANMPAAGRPANALSMPIETLGGSAGYVAVGSQPRIVVDSTPSSNAKRFSSLAAISFPVGS